MPEANLPATTATFDLKIKNKASITAITLNEHFQIILLVPISWRVQSIKVEIF